MAETEHEVRKPKNRIEVGDFVLVLAYSDSGKYAYYGEYRDKEGTSVTLADAVFVEFFECDAWEEPSLINMAVVEMRHIPESTVSMVVPLVDVNDVVVVVLCSPLVEQSIKAKIAWDSADRAEKKAAGEKRAADQASGKPAKRRFGFGVN